MNPHELPHAGIDFCPESPAIEDAVVAYARLYVVLPHRSGDVGADFVRGLGLSDAGNVVVLAFHRHERGAADGARTYAAAAMSLQAARELEFLKYVANRLEVEFFREIAHGKIFVVEVAMLGDAV